MIDSLMPLIKQFLPFAQERMGFEHPPRLFVRRDEQNAQNPLGKTAFYDPAAKSVTLYIAERHPKDVMRSLSHELVHHTQNCNGQFDNVGEMGEGYAQNDTHLREMERQAYEIGNLCFRDWEDSIKQTIYFEHLQKGVEKIMSTKEWKNGEMNTLLTEKWGFSFDLDRLNEGGPHTGGTGDRPTEKRSKKDIAGKKGADSEREKKGLEEMGGCADHDAEEVVVMGDGEPGDDDLGAEGPQDPQALVDELSDVVSRLQSALGGMGSEGEEEMVVDIQERLRTALKSLLETRKGDKIKTGETKGEKAYEFPSKGEKSKTHKGEEDDTTKKGEKIKTGKTKGEKAYKGPSKGEKKEGGGKAYSSSLKGKIKGINEDSEEEEGEHYEDNAMHDEDHIRAIEHHLDALKRDRDYDDEHIEEGGLAHRRGSVKDPRNKRPEASPLGEDQIRAFVREALKKSFAKKK